MTIAGIAAVASGCGDGAAEPDRPTVSLSVTREFGRELLLSERRAPLPDRPTVLELLREHADVETSFGGRSIDAIASARRTDEASGDETIWALIVNGIEADVSPSHYRLQPGDVVQLDLRDWYVTLDVRATVGGFPQTFTRGMFGRRFPVTVECADPAATACRLVREALRRAGVPADGSSPGKPPDVGVQRARILVGPWKRWRGRPWPRRVDRGARYTGIFARFTPTSDTLRLLDWNNHVARSAGPGSGLVGAMLPTDEDLLWLVTGVDAAGVERAARALVAADLRNAFAVVVTREGIEKIPLVPSR